MNRSEMREQAFILLYEKEFFKDKPCEEIEEVFAENISELSEYAKETFENVCERREELDEIISSYLSGWKIGRLPKVNASILRLAIYEIKYAESVPSGVAVNEAVELAKKYSGTDDYTFINGVLGSYLRSL
ncbi:MAG: transcription antitermination factor NusB [Eubacterium sp.]|nr:transcription antitermination factor NusB [Eubacterium sp.]